MSSSSSSSLLLCLPSRAGTWSSRLVKEQWRLSANAASPLIKHATDVNRHAFQQESDRQGQHSSFQKLEASTSVHLALDNFESVDLALDRSVVPGRFDRQPHCTQIAAQGSGELRQKRKP